MRVSISLQVSLKDKPKSHYGILSENWTIGKDKEVKLADAIIDVTQILANFYGSCYPLDELNAELQRAARILAEQRIVDREAHDATR